MVKRWLRIAIASTSEDLAPPYLFWREALSLVLNLCCSFCVLHFVHTYLSQVRVQQSLSIRVITSLSQLAEVDPPSRKQ